MNESGYKRELAKATVKDLPGAVVFKHADRNAGVPDLSISWAGFTAWVEVKLADPKPKLRDQQHRTITRLSVRAAAAFYVVYDIRKCETWVLFPSELADPVGQLRDGWRQTLAASRYSPAIDHGLLARYLKGQRP